MEELQFLLTHILAAERKLFEAVLLNSYFSGSAGKCDDNKDGEVGLMTIMIQLTSPASHKAHKPDEEMAKARLRSHTVSVLLLCIQVK